VSLLTCFLDVGTHKHFEGQILIKVIKKYVPESLRKPISRIRRLLHPRNLTWRINGILRPEKPIICRFGDNLKLRIYPFDIIGRNIYVSGYFELNECRAVQRILRPGMIFFDIGANLGQYTLLAAEKVGPTGHVYSFEPNTRMFGELQFNVQLNSLGNFCTLNKMALSSMTGEAMMLIHSPGSEVYGSLGKSSLNPDAIIGAELVPTQTLDSYIVDNGIFSIDFIKIDVEGAELLVLHGAEHILKRIRPYLLIEISDLNTVNHGYKAKEVVELLSKNDYTLNTISAAGDVVRAEIQDIDFVSGTYLAVPRISTKGE